MATIDDDCHVSDNIDTLTVINKDIVIESSSSNDTKYQRDMSQIIKAFRAEN
jgi:hypothetical protein